MLQLVLLLVKLLWLLLLKWFLHWLLRCLIHPIGIAMLRYAQLLSHVCLSVTPWTVARQAPLSMGFSRQEYWSGLPFPSPSDLPHPGIKPVSPALQVDSLPTEPTCQCSRCKRHRFDPWVGKIHWSRKWKSTPVFLPGKFQGHDWALTHSPISTIFSKNWKHVCINKISSP